MKERTRALLNAARVIVKEAIDTEIASADDPRYKPYKAVPNILIKDLKHALEQFPEK